MTELGITRGLPMAEYLAMPAVSASILKTIIERCPQAAWFDSWLNEHRATERATRGMDAGSIAHSILLEGSRDCVAVIDPRHYPTKTTGNIPEGWTNKDIRQARDNAIADGKIPVLADAMAEIEAMVKAARAFLDSIRSDEPAIYAAFEPGGGDSELTMVWGDDGVVCRIRPDRIATDRRLIVDYKTGGTTAEPDTWGRTQMIRMGYYTSAAFYRRGVQALCGERPDYVFLVQEQAPPFLCSLVGVDAAGYELGAQKISHALKLWRTCALRDKWPAYPTRVCYPELPPWEVARWEEAQGNLAQGIPYDVAKAGWKEAREAVESYPESWLGANPS